LIKKATVEEIIDQIDALHYVGRLKSLADNAESEQVQLNATTKILEITEVIKPQGNRKISAEGSDVRLIIED